MQNIRMVFLFNIFSWYHIFTKTILFGMSFHEVPENLDPVNVAGAEGVVVTIVSIALVSS